MPRSYSVLAGEIIELSRRLSHQSADDAVKTTSLPGHDLLTIKESFHTNIDKKYDQYYQDIIKIEREIMKNKEDELSELANFSFSHNMLAYQFGVDVSDLTPEFFEEQEKIMMEEHEKWLDQFETENGFRPDEMTPEERKILDKRIHEMKMTTNDAEPNPK